MDVVWWTLSLLLMLLGMAASLFPVLPDSLLILGGAFLHHYTLGAKGIGWWTLSALIGLTVLAHVVDFSAGAMGAKRFGASRWGAAGGIIGSVAGLFFFPVGLILGPVIGVLAAEVVLARKTLGPAAKSSWGTLLGTLIGMAGKIFIDALMIGVFFLGWMLHT